MKNVFLFLGIGTLLVIGGCSKTQNKVDFRDALVANYLCTKHYRTFETAYDTLSHSMKITTTDSIVDTLVVTVDKYEGDSTSLFIDGMMYSQPWADSGRIQYTGNGMYPCFAYFIQRKDSLWFNITIERRVLSAREYEYSGHKR